MLCNRVYRCGFLMIKLGPMFFTSRCNPDKFLVQLQPTRSQIPQHCRKFSCLVWLGYSRADRVDVDNENTVNFFFGSIMRSFHVLRQKRNAILTIALAHGVYLKFAVMLEVFCFELMFIEYYVLDNTLNFSGNLWHFLVSGKQF